jgi:hypothetical protein
VATLFEKLGPPPAEKAPPKEKIEQPIDHLEILLEWLMSRWTKNTITLRDISAYGPYPIRKKEIITNLTQILAARGWLIPTKPRQYNAKRWEIARGPAKNAPVVQPVQLCCRLEAQLKTPILRVRNPKILLDDRTVTPKPYWMTEP